ncbi:MAG: glycosyltransferase family 4 protein [Thermoanaerobaculia bacterium]
MIGSADSKRKARLAIVVSHPIQYYVPLYQRLAKRDDLEIRVFYTWHAGDEAVHDRGFGAAVAWDIPIREGYDFALIANCARHPGTHHFFGLQNPSLLPQLMAWRPDAVHVTGWAWASHFRLLHHLHRLGIPALFRGDSHLLDESRRGPRWWVKRALLRRVLSWPSTFLYVGQANRRYYEAFGVRAARLRYCPHAIDVARFAEREEEYSREAAGWRRNLGIAEEPRVLLFAGKFERKKQPLELMRAVLASSDEKLILVLVGGGELQGEVNRLAAAAPARFRVLPFQNQTRMPVVYRLGDLFVLPSAYGETWGLAVNEALACGRPVFVTDRVGCAADVVDETCGRVFPFDAPESLVRAAGELLADRPEMLKMGRAAAKRAWQFHVTVAEETLVGAMAWGAGA